MKVLIYEKEKQVLESLLEVWSLKAEKVIGETAIKEVTKHLLAGDVDHLILSIDIENRNDLRFLEKAKAYNIETSVIVHDEDPLVSETYFSGLSNIFKKPLLTDMFKFIDGI
ncbi:MAG: DNA-binding NarL/FixJ family response regulator [Bacteriovoracaceae bacterium]|jgi:DNA-binding NarL/FixJ family response regulator